MRPITAYTSLVGAVAAAASSDMLDPWSGLDAIIASEPRSSRKHAKGGTFKQKARAEAQRRRRRVRRARP